MIIMTSMISFMSWVIDVTMCFVSCHFMLDIENMMRKFMIIMSVMIVVVIDNCPLNMLIDMFCAIVVFIWNIMELSVFMVHIMAMVGTMSPAFAVMYIAMMAISMVVSDSVMLVSYMSSVAVVVGVMFTVSRMLVVVITSIMSPMDVSWTIFIMMSLRMSIVVGLCKDLIETVGTMRPSLAMMSVWVVAIVVAFVSPVGFGMIFTKVIIKTVVMATVFMVHVMMEVWIMIVMMTVSIMVFRVWVSVVTVPVVVVYICMMTFNWARVIRVRVVVISWFTANWSHMSMMMVISVHICVGIWLHFKNQITFLNIRLGSSESSAVGIKCGIITLMPSVGIKHIEVILPVEVKATCLMVVCVSLDVVEEQVPRHVLSIQALSP